MHDLVEQFARCPRCGYDQRGVMATWTESCPLEGRCSECGLEYRWAEVLCPEKYEPPWCVEFVRLRRLIPRSCLTTFARSFHPWGFWTRVQMSQPMRPVRLAIYAGVMLMAMLMHYVLLQGLAAVSVRYQVQRSIAQEQTAIPARIAMYQRQLQDILRSKQINPQGNYRNQENFLKQQLNDAQQLLQSPPVINVTYARAIVDAVFHPLGTFPPGTITYPSGTTGYVAPIQVWSMAFGATFYSGGFLGTTGSFGRSAISLVIWLAFGVGLVLLVPILFVLMPWSMRRAKVRWWHVVRAAVYSLFIVITVLSCVSVFIIRSASTGSGGLNVWVALTAQFLPPIALVIWWGSVITRYMKIRVGFFNAFMLVLLASLAGLVAIQHFAPWMITQWWL